MKETPDCERASDLITFLYNEADERERRDFQLHLNECRACRAEVASFGAVRESITAWRDEALAGFVSRPVVTNRKSALAALRQFFDLSPLWLKGATAFAIIAFCVLAGMVFVNLRRSNVQVSSTTKPSEAIYTQEQVDHLVNRALATHTMPKPEVGTPPIVVDSRKPKRSRNSGAH